MSGMKGIDLKDINHHLYLFTVLNASRHHLDIKITRYLCKMLENACESDMLVENIVIDREG